MRTGEFKKCNCGERFWAYRYKINTGKKLYCSRVCANLGQKGKSHSPETQFKIGNKSTRKYFSGEKHPLWKGNAVSYGTLHDWVQYHKGKPQKYVKCSKDFGRIEWANKDRKYKRILSHFIALCKSCHTKHDLNLIKKCV